MPELSAEISCSFKLSQRKTVNEDEVMVQPQLNKQQNKLNDGQETFLMWKTSCSVTTTADRFTAKILKD